MAVYLWDKNTKRRITFAHAIDAKEAMATGRFLHEEPRPAPVEEKKEPEQVETKTIPEKEEKEEKKEEKVVKKEPEKEEKEIRGLGSKKAR